MRLSTNLYDTKLPSKRIALLMLFLLLLQYSKLLIRPHFPVFFRGQHAIQHDKTRTDTDIGIS